jgi:hypothetical protein
MLARSITTTGLFDVFDDDSIDRITMASFPIFDDPSAHFLGDDDCLDEFFGLW